MEEKPYAVVVGGINMDVQGRSSGAFLLGDSNPGEASLSPGGVGRNIAENLLRLGLRTELVSVLGDDALSAALEASSSRLGLGLSSCLRLPGKGASQYLCLLDAAGSLIGAVAAMENLEALLPEELAARAALLDGAALLVLDANLPAASLAYLAGRYGRGGELESAGLPRPRLAVDPVSRAKAGRLRGLLKRFDLAKPNKAEAELLAGRSISSEAELPELARALRAAEGGPVELFISLGPGGLYFDAGPASSDSAPASGLASGIARPPRLGLRNVSGAGDAACAALAWSALKGYTSFEPQAGGRSLGQGLGRGIAYRAALAVAASSLTAGAETTVSTEMGPERLIELAQGVVCEPIS